MNAWKEKIYHMFSKSFRHQVFMNTEIICIRLTFEFIECTGNLISGSLHIDFSWQLPSKKWHQKFPMKNKMKSIYLSSTLPLQPSFNK